MTETKIQVKLGNLPSLKYMVQSRWILGYMDQGRVLRVLPSKHNVNDNYTE